MGLKFFDWWRRLPRWQRRASAAAAIAVMALGIDALGLRPLRRQVARMRQETRSLEAQLQQALRLSAQAEAIEQAYEAYRAFLPAEDGGADGRDPVRVHSQIQSEIETAAREAGMNLLTVRPIAPDARGAADQLSVAMEAEASPVELVRWLDRVRRSPSLLKVTRLALRVPDEESARLRCSVVVTKLLLGAGGAERVEAAGQSGGNG